MIEPDFRANIIASAGLADRLHVKQSEVHGMSQRGGAVLAHLRLADQPIESDLIPLGGASMVLAMEPLESLRYLEYLSPSGTVITATEPITNMRAYPPIDDVIATLATRADVAGIRTVVVSTDRDAFQLCSPNVALMMTPRGVSDVHVYTPERVLALMTAYPPGEPWLFVLLTMVLYVTVAVPVAYSTDSYGAVLLTNVELSMSMLRASIARRLIAMRMFDSAVLRTRSLRTKSPKCRFDIPS